MLTLMAAAYCGLCATSSTDELKTAFGDSFSVYVLSSKLLLAARACLEEHGDGVTAEGVSLFTSQQQVYT